MVLAPIVWSQCAISVAHPFPIARGLSEILTGPDGAIEQIIPPTDQIDSLDPLLIGGENE